MRILILEDNFMIQRELWDLVAGMGHEAVLAADAGEATEILKTTGADAVIADVFIRRGGSYIPEGGLLLLNRVRMGPDLGLRISRNAPVMVMSGAREIPGGYSPLSTASEMGADVCLRKPLDMDEVSAWISEIAVASSLR